MPSKVELCNQALGHLGVGDGISNLETERSQNARACRLFFDQVVDEMLRKFAWPFATKLAALQLLATDPNDEWGFSYRYPNDCLYLRRILSGTRVDTSDTRVPFKVAQDAVGKVVYTDMEDAQVEYTVRITDVNRFSPDFAVAFTYLLASKIAPRLEEGDPFKLADRCLRLYVANMREAAGQALNESAQGQDPDADLIRSR